MKGNSTCVCPLCNTNEYVTEYGFMFHEDWLYVTECNKCRRRFVDSSYEMSRKLFERFLGEGIRDTGDPAYCRE